ncbi:MAG: GH92 family glycosyl hydrolase [Muribaculaceae bacterium]|nr:GH92 family glycosyl hydrolase [Muribaculaceae bacterium]
MKKCRFFFGALLAACTLLSAMARPAQQHDVLDYVDPLIGSGGHGHVTVSACVPFGLVQLGPSSVYQDWDWCSGYHRSDSIVIGFPHTHLSGTGCGDLHDVTVMPVVGQVKYARGNDKDPQSGMWSYADRSREVAQPGYYRTHLTRYNVGVELTATARTGLHRYTFPASGESAIIFNLVDGGNWDNVETGVMRVLDDHTIEGVRWSTGWAHHHPIYFHAEFSKPFVKSHLMADGREVNADWVTARRVHGRFDFNTSQGEQIMVKVGISAVSVQGAAMNLAAEQQGWDFDGVRERARSAWREQLNKIQVQSQDVHVLRNFYTAMFHTMIAPSVFCDVDGAYQGSDYAIHTDPGFVNYTTYSLWDTYRGAHPLMTIIHPERVPDIINTMLRIYQEQGKLPIWHLMGRETNCMVGSPGIPVVADAVLKNFPGIDQNLAIEAMERSMLLDERGLKWHRTMGHIPYDKMNNNNVAHELEYELADWALAQAARKVGRNDLYERHMALSRQYRNLFDPATGFIRARDSQGKFIEPFDAYRPRTSGDEYCEGNAWQYTWLVPHDLPGLVQCHGSRELTIARLDSLFTVSSDVGDQAVPDMSGFIGQYVHGNEPSHHIIYFYTMLDQPWKTADRVREVLTTLYHDTPDGLCGNEDVGQMSAWYILSAMGFYQVEPAGGHYYFGSPLLDKATVRVAGGTLTITAKNNSAKNRYIQRIALNGKPYKKPFIDHADIAAGGTLEYTMGSRPTKWW